MSGHFRVVFTNIVDGNEKKWNYQRRRVKTRRVLLNISSYYCRNVLHRLSKWSLLGYAVGSFGFEIMQVS
jgi:hypothetical protein